MADCKDSRAAGVLLARIIRRSAALCSANSGSSDGGPNTAKTAAGEAV